MDMALLLPENTPSLLNQLKLGELHKKQVVCVSICLTHSAELGVREGDQLLKINGMPVSSSNHFEVIRMISGKLYSAKSGNYSK